MKHLRLLLFCILISSRLSAQVIASDSLSKHISLKALDLLDQFSNTLKFNNKDCFNLFPNYFHNTSASIFNDVMPDNHLDQKVKIQDYLTLIKKYYTDTSFIDVNIRPYDISLVSLEGDQYAMLSINAKKMVVSKTIHSVFYIDTFNIRFDFIYDFNTNAIKIYDIVSIEKRDKYLQMQPFYKGLMFKNALVADTIVVNNKMYNVNSAGYTQINNVNSSSEFLAYPIKNPVMFKMYRVPNSIPLIKNKLDEKDPNIVKINFWRWMVFFDFKYHIIPNGVSPIKLESDTFGINTINNGSFSNFIMLNLVRRVSEKGYWSVKIGGGADVFNYQVNLRNNVNSYNTIDPDGDRYLRINRVYNIQENHRLVYTTAPLIIEKGFCFGKNEIYLNLSYHLMLNFSAFYNQDAEALYAGYYEYLFNLYISENGVYDFGTYKFNLRNVPLVVDPMIYTYGFGLGYNRQLSRKVYFNLGYNYRKSNSYLFMEDNRPLSNNNKELNSIKSLNNRFVINYSNINFGLSIKL